jgi:hypothetical protein
MAPGGLVMAPFGLEAELTRLTAGPLAAPGRHQRVWMSLIAYIVVFVLTAYLAFDLWRPDVLLVGNVTIDVLGAGPKKYRAPGGAGPSESYSQCFCAGGCHRAGFLWHACSGAHVALAHLRRAWYGVPMPVQLPEVCGDRTSTALSVSLCANLPSCFRGRGNSQTSPHSGPRKDARLWLRQADGVTDSAPAALRFCTQGPSLTQQQFPKVSDVTRAL